MEGVQLWGLGISFRFIRGELQVTWPHDFSDLRLFSRRSSEVTIFHQLSSPDHALAEGIYPLIIRAVTTEGRSSEFVGHPRWIPALLHAPCRSVLLYFQIQRTLLPLYLPSVRLGHLFPFVRKTSLTSCSIHTEQLGLSPVVIHRILSDGSGADLASLGSTCFRSCPKYYGAPDLSAGHGSSHGDGFCKGSR